MKIKKITLINKEDFSEKYNYSIKLNDEFWFEEGKKILDSDANYNVYFHRVSKNVNNPLNDSPSLIDKVHFL